MINQISSQKCDNPDTHNSCCCVLHTVSY